MKSFVCEHLHQPGGWLSPGTLVIDDEGRIAEVHPAAPRGPAVRLPGFTIPGMANVHSHAFQRALSGLTGAPAATEDSFWTWRTAMYRLASALGPDDLCAIAAQVYVEMLEAGFTAVGEFHYLHHQPDGRPYDDPAEMSAAVLEGARVARMPITLLPVAYFCGDFGQPAHDQQRRFVFSRDDRFLAYWHGLRPRIARGLEARLGVAPHSLRAVPPASLRTVVGEVRGADPTAPIHIHIAEQPREVERCRTHLGARPVAWLLDHVPVDGDWTLIHATHVDPAEVTGIIASGATVGLCPTTEADLGDGLFPAEAFVAGGGRWGIGTDANVRTEVAMELALLEWGQRLRTGRRNVLSRPGPSGAVPSLGRGLFDDAAAGGAAALRQPMGQLTTGQRGDFVVLDPHHDRLVGHPPTSALDAWIFSGPTTAITEVWVAGEPVVRDGAHVARVSVRAAFDRAMARLIDHR